MMKAIVYNEYGSPEVLHTEELEKPVPGTGDILIRVKAASVNFGDLIARKVRYLPARDFHMPSLFLFMAKLDFGIKKPKRRVLGSEFSGIVESTGTEVKHFKPGDRVFGYLGQKMGAYAEYICVPEKGVLALMPDKLGFEEAAVIPMGAIMALHLLRKKGNIQPGQKVLVNGASGSIGSAAVQISRNHFGAEVTGVCGTLRMEYVNSLGADKVIDYSREDFTRMGEKYDLIFDVLGKSSFKDCRKVLNENGRYLLASFKMKQLFQMLRTKISGSKKVICALAPGSVEDLLAVKGLIEAGKLTSIIDRTFSIDQAAEAHRYVEEGRKQGNVAIKLG